MTESIDEILKELKRILKPKRYRHTQGVRYTAQAMAMCFGEDIVRAGYAGALHDCAKYLSEEKMLSQCKKYGISVSKAEKKQPELLHAKLGKEYAREIYGVEDEGILSAIRWHTTGKEDMDRLEKIVYIADYIEPNRKPLPGMPEIREMAFRNLDETMYLILKNTLQYLQESRGSLDAPIEEHSMEAYAFYKELHEKRCGGADEETKARSIHMR